MKTLKSSKSKGFTLIELMVVIAIIALLSSIVLASLKDARSKADETKFKSEINQFVNALELYRAANNGKYPYDVGTNPNLYASAYFSNSNTETRYNHATPLSTLMLPYLKTLPKVPSNSFTAADSSWIYSVNQTPDTGQKWRCKGDIGIPKYIIMFSNQNPTTFNFFNSLPMAQYATGPVYILAR